MARDFDGTDDNLNGGNDSSIADFVAVVMAWHGRRDASGAGDMVISKAASTANGYRASYATTDVLSMTRDYSGGVGAWNGDTNINGAHACIVSHDGNVANDPRMVVDGVVNTISIVAAPSGTLDADATSSLILGETSIAGNDLDGALQNVVLHDAVFSADEENRHRWWGCAPGGPSTVKAWFPFYTDGLVNKGTATITFTPTGTTVTSLPMPTVRPGFALMGCGVGW